MIVVYEKKKSLKTTVPDERSPQPLHRENLKICKLATNSRNRLFCQAFTKVPSSPCGYSV